MIRIGPAGIPLSCKGRTNKDGIIYVKKILDLNAMEIQLIRGIQTMDDEEADFIRKFAEENDIELHVHAPYYTNLAGDDEEIELSKNKILYSGRLANRLGAKILVIHPGFYGERSKEETMERIIENAKDIVSRFKEEKIKVKLGIETMGKQKVFGSLDEVIEVCKKVKGTVPAIDLGHIHARCNGCLKTREDFEKIFEKLKPLKLKHYLIHITGVLYENGNEYYHIPIKKGDMPLEPLIDIILDNKYNVTLISESPLLEHDAMYIRLQIERAIQKRTGIENPDYRDLSLL
ncbi:MAG: TIM barrel protein [Thermoplasmata archaeon]|nr:MAG: TIM barrel protein [Thermoplasmata archaeon]KAA0013376.1 MAG: TIM barrel protein [Thermoplasmata archaeon]